MCSGAGTSKAQKPTNARKVGNMNEAQLVREISKAERRLSSAERAMRKNSGDTAFGRELEEAFPLGVGSTSGRNRRAIDRDIERTVKRAKAYTEAQNRYEGSRAYLDKLNTTLNKVRGTGKTLNQIKAESAKETVKNTPSTLKWKTTQKAEWSNGGYRPKIISSGAYEIRGSSGSFSIYKNGKQIGGSSKLATAKAFVERDIRK